MDKQNLNQRCVELMHNPQVKNHMWHPPMFWEVGDLDNPVDKDLTSPKVDVCELEVLLSAAANEDSVCASELEQRDPGRAAFIRRMVRRGDMPLLMHE